ncbi:MAG: Crp/Fnr family transcriptional regulator [Candidatus Goldbacteria bacterium]|nr:Crp/Fnr family transcriptional regulator [Candidatus Goldiibacteriota bacterium]
MTKNEIISFLKQTHLFAEVSDNGLRRISDFVKENYYEKGQIVFNEGEKGDTLHIIVKGRVKITKYTQQGKIKILAILNEKDNFGEMALLTDEARTATVEAIDDVITLSIARQEFMDILKTESSISLQIIKTLCHRLAKADRDLKNFFAGNAKVRISCVLLDFKDENNIVKLTHQEIADIAGLTRETTTRILNNFAANKIIETRSRKINIIDLEKLKEISI